MSLFSFIGDRDAGNYDAIFQADRPTPSQPDKIGPGRKLRTPTIT